jgi:hypothetical protein
VLINEVVGETVSYAVSCFVEDETYVQTCLVGMSTDTRCKSW